MKELSLDEISLLEEMKSNCLKKGQYIDEKAKDKFNMLCHLEDFGIAYYELLDTIKEVREYIEKSTQWYDKELGLVEMEGYDSNRIPVVYLYGLLEIIDKENNDE